MQPFEFGRFVAKKFAAVQGAADAPEYDNELSPDALAGMQQTAKMLKAPERMARPLVRQPAVIDMPMSNTKVPPLPSKSPAKSIFEQQYDEWRMAQGLTPGHGTPARPLAEGMADAPAPIRLPVGRPQHK
jgi:hypothetical protein